MNIASINFYGINCRKNAGDKIQKTNSSLSMSTQRQTELCTPSLEQRQSNANVSMKNTDVHIAAEKNPKALEKFCLESPQKVKNALSSPNDWGSTPVHMAACNAQSLEILCDYFPDEVKSYLGKVNDYGYTPVHHAVENPDSIKLLCERYPKEVEEIITLSGDDRYHKTPLQISTKYPESLGLMAEKAPEELGQALLVQDIFGSTPVHKAAVLGAEYMQIMEKTAPKEFAQALTVTDLAGNTPVHQSIKDERPDSLNIIAKAAPEQLGKTLFIQDKYTGNTILHHPPLAKFMKTIAEAAPEQFGQALLIQDKRQNTPVYVSAQHSLYEKNFERLNIMEKTAPEEFRQALLIQNVDGRVPLHAVVGVKEEVNEEYLKDLEMMIKADPNQLLVQDNAGNTPVHLAAKDKHGDICLKIMEKAAPEQFEKALDIQNYKKQTPLYIKKAREYSWF